MLCATMTGKVGRKPVPPLSGVCSWASVIRTRQGVGSKNFCICVIVRFRSLSLFLAVACRAGFQGSQGRDCQRYSTL